MSNRKTRRLFESALSKLPQPLAQEVRTFFFPTEISVEHAYVRTCKPKWLTKKNEALLRLAFEKVNAKILIAGIGGLGSLVAETALRMGIDCIICDPKLASIHGQSRGTVTQKEAGYPKVIGFTKKNAKGLSSGATIEARTCTVEELLESGSIDLEEVACCVACTDSIASRETLQEVCIEFSIPFLTGGLSKSEVPLDGYSFWWKPGKVCFGCFNSAIPKDEPAQPEAAGVTELPLEDCSVPINPPLVGMTSFQMAAHLLQILQGAEPRQQVVFTDAKSTSTGFETIDVSTRRPGCACNRNPEEGDTQPPTTPPPNPTNPTPNNPTAPQAPPQTNGFRLH